jgi:hypothetical protein
LLLAKFERNLRSRFSPAAAERVLNACADQKKLEAMSVQELLSLFVDRSSHAPREGYDY